jgi:uncharacterized protein YkwD
MNSLPKCETGEASSFDLHIGERPEIMSMKNYRLLISSFLFFTFSFFLINSQAQTRTAGYLPISAGNSTRDAGVENFEQLVFILINRKRAEISLPPLSWNERAAQAARLHSKNMSLLNFFSHTGLDGKNVADRVELFGLKSWRMVGENIAYNRGYGNPVERVIESWMNSPSHRENLLNKRWRETGVGITVNNGTYYFTQVFVKNE